MSNIHGLSSLNSNNNPASINQNAQHPNNQSFANIPMLCNILKKKLKIFI